MSFETSIYLVKGVAIIPFFDWKKSPNDLEFSNIPPTLSYKTSPPNSLTLFNSSSLVSLCIYPIVSILSESLWNI